MARVEDYIAKPFPVTSTAVVTNTAISLVRAAPVKNTQWAFKKVVLSSWGTGSPAVAPTLTISGGGMPNPIVVIGDLANGFIYAEIEIPHSVLLMAEATPYQIDVPALGAGFIASIWVLDKVVPT